MSDIIFVDGMRFEDPHKNAPDFIKGKISIEVEPLKRWLEVYKDERGWVNIDLKESKAGKLYLSLNEFKPRTDTPAPEKETEPF